MDQLNQIFDTVQHRPVEVFISTLLVVIVIVVVALILYGLFVAVDSWFLPRKESTGRIFEKKYRPAHTELVFVYDAATKTQTQQPIFYPDEWVLWIQVAQDTDSISVSKECYDKQKIGNTVQVAYVTGRLSGGLYLKAIG